jgi:AcrR family transcriptional regulator
MKRLPPQPRRARRGAPEDTRARLVTFAARVFNQRGYHGTDSNAIARAAGYAPGTFYLHFEDKRAVFLAVYERWVESEWAEIGARARLGTLDAPGVVAFVLQHHRDWRGFRASLRALLATDPAVRRFFRKRRREQVETLGRLSASPPPIEERVMLLLTLERVADALADGEADELGADPARLEAALVERVQAYLSLSARPVKRSSPAG